MKAFQLLSELQFSPKRPEADPIYVDRNGRILQFELEPGQSIKGHQHADSPFYVVVLQGQAVFAGPDGQEEQLGPSSLVIFAPGEVHSVRALDERVVFVGFLQGAPSNVSDRVGGALGRGED